MVGPEDRAVIVTPRMLKVAEDALDHEVEPEWLASALEHHALTSLADLKLVLRQEEAEFERRGGRGVDEAEYIDGLRAVIAVRKLKKDPRDWPGKPPRKVRR